MNVGYFSINSGSHDGFVNWEKLSSVQAVEEGSFFRHIRFEKPLVVRMDGKNRMAVVTINH
jgi:hypothetical protein